MSRKRPSPVALVQSYFNEGMGAESTELLAKVTTPVSREKEASPPPDINSEQFTGKLSDGLICDRHTVSVTDGHTAEQLNGPTAKPANTHTVAPLNGQTVGRLTPRTLEPLHTNTVVPPNSRTLDQSHSLSVEETDRLSVNTYDQQTVEHPTSVTVEQQTPQTVNYQTIPLDVLTLSYNQAAVLDYLISSNGITSYRTISESTKIGIPSVRDAISRLIRRGFLAEPVTIRSATFQGFSYVLNDSMTQHFVTLGGLEQRNYQTVTHHTGRIAAKTDPQTLRPSHGKTPYSSSLIKELTTTKDNQTDKPSDGQTASMADPPVNPDIRQSDIKPSDIFILSGPVGIYWEGLGLQESQAKKWCEQFEIEPAQMKQQLEWARFDLVVNDKLADVRKDAISWFFGCLRQTGGCYNRPANYKSPAEIRAEEMEKAAQELAEARNRQSAAEKELAFQKILSNQDSAEYQRLLSMVNQFAKEMGGKALEAALREAYASGTQKNS